MPWYLPRRACTYQRPDGQLVPIRFWLTSKRTQHRNSGQGLGSHHPVGPTPPHTLRAHRKNRRDLTQKGPGCVIVPQPLFSPTLN